MDANCTATNECNTSHQDRDEVSPIPFIAISIVHMTVVIVPTTSLGTIILYNVYAHKEFKTRDPITACDDILYVVALGVQHALGYFDDHKSTIVGELFVSRLSVGTCHGSSFLANIHS